MRCSTRRASIATSRTRAAVATRRAWAVPGWRRAGTSACTRRLIDVETHRAVFTWVQAQLVTHGLLTGKTLAVDATTLEVHAAMRSIVRRNTGETYQAYLTQLAARTRAPAASRGSLAEAPRA